MTHSICINVNGNYTGNLIDPTVQSRQYSVDVFFIF